MSRPTKILQFRRTVVAVPTNQADVVTAEPSDTREHEHPSAGGRLAVAGFGIPPASSK
jgi:hypothetical protein